MTEIQVKLARQKKGHFLVFVGESEGIDLIYVPLDCMQSKIQQDLV